MGLIDEKSLEVRTRPQTTPVGGSGIAVQAVFATRGDDLQSDSVLGASLVGQRWVDGHVQPQFQRPTGVIGLGVKSLLLRSDGGCHALSNREPIHRWQLQ